MRGVRGQVTAFVLVGLALLIVLAIIFALKRAVEDTTQPSDQLGQEYDGQLVQDYVLGCVDLVMNEALGNVARHGGLLYDEENGESEHGPLEAGVHALLSHGVSSPASINISYGLMNDSRFPMRPSWRSPPDYPAPSSNLSLLYDVTGPLSVWLPDQYDGPFGQYALPKLCDPNGANNLSQDENVKCPRMLFERQGSLHGASIQRNLKGALERGLPLCINEERLSETLGASVTMEAPNATVVFTEHETIVNVELPLHFTSDEGALKKSLFTRRYAVRLLPMYRFVYNLLKRASKDPFFRIDDASSYRNVPGYDRFTVTKHLLSDAQFAGDAGTSVILINDPASTLDGDAWYFQFLVENRRPVLDYIPNATLRPSSPLLYFNATDPDGDMLNITFTSTNSTGGVRTNISTGFGPSFLLNLYDHPQDTYTANLTIEDPYGLKDWQAFNITIQ